jgi:DNA-binding NarL/FixJ family response regulator
MPKLDGFAAAQVVLDEDLPVSVIFLTMHRELKLFERALDLGVKGYVLKDSAAREIIRAVKAVASGQSFVSAELTTYLIEARKNSSKVLYSKQQANKLSVAEGRVLSMIADGLTTSEIADALHVSPRTIEGHRTHICQKLGLHGSHALLKYALQQKAASNLDSILKNT